MTDIVRSEPIAFTRGQDFTLVVTVYTPDTITNGVVVRSTTPQNVSGRTFVLTISRRKNDTDKLITKTLSTLVAADGTITTTILSADCVNIQPGTYHYDVWRTDSGYMEPIVKGPCEITGNSRYPA